MRLLTAIIVSLIVILFIQAVKAPAYDVIIRQGTLYDGSGNKPYVGDIGLKSDTIATIGNLSAATGKIEIDAKGLAVTPGFINMLSMAERSLLMDGRSMSDIKQGVTLEVMGEGWSAGPAKRKSAKPVDSLWTTLDGYFKWLIKKGTSTNVASFVGATTVRNYVLGQENRKPTAAEQQKMNDLVREAMEQGAMGLSTSLIYAPADFASTEEIISLASEAAKYNGMYITHMRSESDNILKALNETFRIANDAGIRTEIYHLKINHDRNWNKIDQVLSKIDSAQKAGLKITANMYPYTASNTALTARLPTWVQEGGAGEMRKRLRNPATRKKVLEEMRLGIPTKNSDPKSVVILGFRLDSLNKLYRGKRLDEVAAMHGKDADETLLDLLIKDRSPGAGVYHLQTEDNVRRIFKQPYVSFGSDGASFSDAKIFEEWGTHPRAFGTFARAIGKYSREEKLVPLQEIIRRMTSLPANNLNIKNRGKLQAGYYADIVIFDAEQIIDKATYDEPKQYAVGMRHVLVNGTPVLVNGVHTGAMPGRVVRGPGWKKK